MYIVLKLGVENSHLMQCPRTFPQPGTVLYIQCVSVDSTSFVIYPELEATEVRFPALKRYLCSFYFRIDNQTGRIQWNTLYKQVTRSDVLPDYTCKEDRLEWISPLYIFNPARLIYSSSIIVEKLRGFLSRPPGRAALCKTRGGLSRVIASILSFGCARKLHSTSGGGIIYFQCGQLSI